MDKNAVLFSYDFLPILEDLTANGNPQAAADLTIAIVKYDRDDTEPVFSDPAVSFVWRTVIKPKLDEYKTKYAETVKRNRENGAKGGRPKKQDGLEETEKTQSVFNNPSGLEKPKQTRIDKNRLEEVRLEEIREEDSSTTEKEKDKKEKPQKHKYCQYKNVLLSD